MVNAMFLARMPDTHKGHYGRVCVLGAHSGMMGATRLAVMGALRAGAGLLYVAAPEALLPFFNILIPESVIKGYPGQTGQLSYAAMDHVLSDLLPMDALVVGPGLGVTSNNRNVILSILKNYPGPVVLDADGINNLKPADFNNILAKVIMTPHAAEFARFLNVPTDLVFTTGAQLAQRVALELDLILVLKGSGTVVTDGKVAFRNPTGNPGMATAGSGDVLSGIISALAGVGHSALESAASGVYLHGLSGDLAIVDRGEYGLIASDIVEYIPKAIMSIQGIV